MPAAHTPTFGWFWKRIALLTSARLCSSFYIKSYIFFMWQGTEGMLSGPVLHEILSHINSHILRKVTDWLDLHLGHPPCEYLTWTQRSWISLQSMGPLLLWPPNLWDHDFIYIVKGAGTNWFQTLCVQKIRAWFIYHLTVLERCKPFEKWFTGCS